MVYKLIVFDVNFISVVKYYGVEKNDKCFSI